MDGWIWMKRNNLSSEMSFITRQKQKTKENLSASMKFIKRHRQKQCKIQQNDKNTFKQQIKIQKWIAKNPKLKYHKKRIGNLNWNDEANKHIIIPSSWFEGSEAI
jgi:hypothetical protein